MAIIEYEDEIKELVNRDNHDEFIYDFLSIYDKISKSTITKLRKGTNNLAKNPGEVYLKNKLYFKEIDNDVLSAFIHVETFVSEISSKPRYIIVTDYDRLLAKDTKTKDSLDIKFTQLPKYFEFFLAWNGIEKVDFEKENPADIKAAEYFARIYDQLLNDNENVSRHGFNLFLIRLLFCLFAEDTGIFKDNSFTDFLKMMTADDGSDMNERISELFAFLDKKIRSGNEPAYLLEFPYVNGQLFTDSHEDIIFSKKTRKSIIDAGELIGWSKVNPDILGSMLQAVASDNKRSHLGMHYTSVPNILKVIKPLFIDDLRNDFQKSKGDENKLNKLYDKIGKIKFMDPACGSGNFLIITYKELRQLEIDIIKELNDMGIATMYVPSVKLSQFFGVEIDDFACDITRLSLWIAEHQMNKKLEDEIHNAVRPTLPLQKAGAIVCGNALRMNWEEIMPKDSGKCFIFGNPPYRGASRQDLEQKNDLKLTSKGVIKGYKKLDYVSGWFIKASDYSLNANCEFAFVSTNSICQGEQVPLLWDYILKNNYISFCHTSFNWKNNAKGNAAVIVVIVGITPRKMERKYNCIYSDNKVKRVKNISPYLTEINNDVVVKKSKKSLFNLPTMFRGNMPTDGGGLILTPEEYNNLQPNIKKFVKLFVGSKDSINGNHRYVLWLNSRQYEQIKNNDFIKSRINIVVNMRKASKKKSTNMLALTPWKFEYISQPDSYKNFTILVPRVSSVNRLYMTASILNEDSIVSDTATAIYNAPMYLFSILESHMHMVWLKNVGGRLKNDYRYSSDLVYNTFPVPKITKEEKKKLEDLSFEILDIRNEEGGTLADLYGSPNAKKSPKKMNPRLLEVHKKLDNLVDSVYRKKGFSNDDERLSLLLNMYDKKIRGEK